MASAADRRNSLALCHHISFADIQRGAVHISGADAIPVVDSDPVTGGLTVRRQRDRAAGRRINRCSLRGGNVNALMVSGADTTRRLTRPEVGCDRTAVRRPDHLHTGRRDQLLIILIGVGNAVIQMRTGAVGAALVVGHPAVRGIADILLRLELFRRYVPVLIDVLGKARSVGVIASALMPAVTPEACPRFAAERPAQLCIQ